jgi:hypothetical protein
VTERIFGMHYGISSTIYSNVDDAVILVYSKKMHEEDYRYLVKEELEDINESMGTKV